MTSRTPVHDYLVATSDRRRELRGKRWDYLREGTLLSIPLSPQMDRLRLRPRFEKGAIDERQTAIAHLLPEAPPDAAAERAAAAGTLSASEKLAVLLRHSAWPHRWEPLNPCGQHRAVATAGALFPIDLYLLARTRGGGRVLYCSPRDLCLLETGVLSNDVMEEAAEACSLVIVGSLGRCVRTYGDVALWLVALEAGMLQAQTGLVARSVGWRLDSSVQHDYEAARALVGLDHWSDVPLMRCRLSGGDAASAVADLQTCRLETIRPRPGHDATELHPLMRAFLQHAGPAPAEALAPASASLLADERTQRRQELEPEPEPEPEQEQQQGTAVGRPDERMDAASVSTPSIASRSILSLSAERSSALGNGIARWSRDLPIAVLEAMLADTRQLLRDSRCAAPFTAQRQAVSLVWRETMSGPVRLFDLDPVQARMTALPISEEASRVALGMCRYNTALLVTIGADGIVAGEANGARLLINEYLRAGVLAQCFSLAAAGRGLTARLFMAYADDLKNLLMPLRMRALVQILIGFDARSNPAFPIF